MSECDDMNKFIKISDILKLIKFNEENNNSIELEQIIEKHDDIFTYRFSILTDNENHHFDSKFDEQHLVLQLQEINESEKNNIIKNIKCIVNNFDLDKIMKPKNVCRT